MKTQSWSKPANHLTALETGRERVPFALPQDGGCCLKAIFFAALVVGCIPEAESSYSMGLEYMHEQPADYSICGKIEGEFVILLNDADERTFRIVLSRLLSEGLHVTELACPREWI